MAFHLSFRILMSLLVLVTLSTLECANGCVERERLALLDFKKSFSSNFPKNHGKLSSWNSTKEAENCCTWEGIACDRLTGYVTSLDLYYQDLESRQLQPSRCELQYLDSLDLSHNNFTMRIPKFIGCLRKLTRLRLSDVGFFGMIPPQLGNLSSLQSLYLDGGSNLSTDNFQWLSHLSSLESLSMENMNFTEARDWLSVTTKLHFLDSFECVWCYFPTPDVLSTTTHHVNSSSSLQTLSLQSSYFSSSTLSSLMNSASNLSVLGFYDLELDVGIFNSIGNLCSLSSLDVSSCIIKGSLCGIIEAMSDCATNSLDSISIESSNLTGTIPPMSKFQSLASLSFAYNRLDHIPPINGSLPETLSPFPSSLTYLHLGNNNLTGVLSDVHFANLSQLQELSLSNNPNLSVHFNKPLTRAESVDLSFCNLGPNFQSWLLSLNSIIYLNISNCKISHNIPIMFWTNLSSDLNYLDLSSNNLYGRVPNIPFEFSYSYVYIDLSSNALSGQIPFFLFRAFELHLSNNNFSGFAPVIPHLYNLSASRDPTIWGGTPIIVDISNNLLTGLIPQWLGFQMPNLGALFLTNNNLSGTIPSSIRYIKNLYVLNLRSNSFSGPLPSVLKNIPTLGILDLGGNIFSGSIPSWMGEDHKHLTVLSLGSNQLSGIIPAGLCRLNSLHVLDLSHNTLSGNIPTCIQDFNAMSHYVNSSQEVSYPAMNMFVSSPAYVVQPIEYASYFNAYIKWKNSLRQFRRTNLNLVKLIDLSSNNLSGEIPTGLTTLVELDSLDLSCNNLQGTIPGEIGQLKSLEYLNLSYNRLSGPIPPSLEISSLGMLDLSHNNFTGRIPSGTQLGGFNASAYSGNPYLCGLPLNKCPGDGPDAVQPSPIQDSEMKDKWQEEQCFFAGLGTGFAFGFLGILGSLTWIRKWRYAFFHVATQFGEWILLVVALNISKISRNLQLK